MYELVQIQYNRTQSSCGNPFTYITTVPVYRLVLCNCNSKNIVLAIIIIAFTKLMYIMKVPFLPST